MFGWLKPKSVPATSAAETPDCLELEIDVACAADTLFGFINCADDRFWQQAIGNVDYVAPGRFRLHLNSLPEYKFTLLVREAEPGRLFAYDIQATPRIGKLVTQHVRYEIAPIDSGNCTVKLRVDANFEASASRSERDAQSQELAISVNDMLAKLKIHAEQGGELLRHVEELQNAA